MHAARRTRPHTVGGTGDPMATRGAAARPARTLVIGYGSDLRGDDAAGRRAADAVTQRCPPGMEVRSVHQLTPELAADVVGRDTVIFVDATAAGSRLAQQALSATPAPGATTHHVDAGGVVALAGLLGRPPTRAWLVSIPAVDFAVGAELSPVATAGVAEAVNWILAHHGVRDERAPATRDGWSGGAR